MKKAVSLQVLAVLSFLGAGMWMAGCKSAPDLTQAQAISLIQAKYDQSPGITFNITVNDRGMQQGVAAKYWAGTKRFPNGYWGDFALTPDGKKAVKLLAGGDVIQWRPEGPTDPHYATVVVPLVVSHLKARSPGDLETVADTRTLSYIEEVDLTGMPDALQNIAHNPGNKLTTQRLATFVLNNGTWTLQSIV